MRYRLGLAAGVAIVLLWVFVTGACDSVTGPRPLFVTASMPLVTATCGTLGPVTRVDSVTWTVSYTAPASGPCKIIARDSVYADTSTVTVVAASLVAGIPFGPYRCMSNGCPDPFTLSADFNSPSTIVQQIADARTKGVTIMLAMTGGAHRADDYGCCLAVINGVLQFSLDRWRQTMATFNTAVIRSAIAAGVADGTIMGATVMDEPYVKGGGDGNTWGPAGTMTKARIDGLCGEVKTMFPTLPAGVEHQHQLFEPTKSYAICDFIVDQYGTQYGDVTTWRDAGLAMGRRDHHAIAFSINVLNGGVQDKDGTYDCAGAGQAGVGLYAPNCRLTASDLKRIGLILYPSGCSAFMWRYDSAYFTRSDNRASFQYLADALSSLTRKPCART